jgi:serine/threonine protein phosphatase PrpC
MEDGFFVVDSFLGQPHEGLVAVIDGHGGPEVMEHCRDNLADAFIHQLSQPSSDTSSLEDAFKATFA